MQFLRLFFWREYEVCPSARWEFFGVIEKRITYYQPNTIFFKSSAFLLLEETVFEKYLLEHAIIIPRWKKFQKIWKHHSSDLILCINLFLCPPLLLPAVHKPNNPQKHEKRFWKRPPVCRAGGHSRELCQRYWRKFCRILQFVLFFKCRA